MRRTLQISTMALLMLAGQLQKAKGQYVLIEADKQYALYNFNKAIDLYEQAYKKRPSLYAAERLAEAYWHQNNYKQTESWYAIAAGMPGTKAANILAYARALQQNSKYAEAKEQYKKYGELDKTVGAGQQSLWQLSCDSAMRWMKSPTGTVVKNEGRLNTAQSDWGATSYGTGLVFASDRGSALGDKQGAKRPFLRFDGAKRPDRTIYGWTGNHYLRLYSADAGTDSVVVFPVGANTDYHVGPASFTKDGQEMFFTMTRIPRDPVYVKGKLATVNVEIYSSKKDSSGKWAAPVGFRYNNVDGYSVGDPFVSADGNSLYFASNMPNGLGGSDIYVSQRTGAGDWGTPENLREINTAGNERTPVFDAANNFYFSSDGRIGMGGLDIYRTRLSGGGIMEPRNLGYPTNSPQDDFAYMRTTGQSGYLSSNRADGLGEDDIYSFMEAQALAFRLIGRALDKNSHQPLGNAIVTLSKINGQSLKVQTDERGDFRFDLDKASDYSLTGEKTNYRSDVGTLSTNNLTASTEIKKDLYLEKIELEKAIRLENIYYDFDRSNIRADAAVELDKLVKILKDNPTIWIELGSHTDSRGNDQYNQWLSQSRANSAVQYIIDRGVEKNRITARGYGESRLLNKCSNGARCTEAEHQLNRRTEFKITKQ